MKTFLSYVNLLKWQVVAWWWWRDEEGSGCVFTGGRIKKYYV